MATTIVNTIKYYYYFRLAL